MNIRVKPRAHRNGIAGFRGDALLVEVVAPPDHGKANQACLKTLAEVLGIAHSRLEITVGHTKREKVIRVRGLTAMQVRERLGIR